jgi:hypothetical protein
MAQILKKGQTACRVRDRDGFLPAHVACKYLCSVNVLRVVVAANPLAIFVETNDRSTCLSLAEEETARKEESLCGGLAAELRKMLEDADVLPEFSLLTASDAEMSRASKWIRHGIDQRSCQAISAQFLVMDKAFC